MENKIDRFFKDKLEDHTLPPSEEAWMKVEASLSKKNNIVVWRIAAAILVAGALISAIIWSQLGNKNNEQILATKRPDKDSIKEKTASKISSVENKKEVSPKNKNAPKTQPRFVSPQTEIKSVQKESNKTEIRPVEKLIATEVEKNKSSFAEASEGKEKINTKATPPATIASTKQKPIKLEFTLDDYSSERPVATASEEKSSGLKKVWDLAREVKNGDGPVHEIKNEIFALNFKKNKNQ